MSGVQDVSYTNVIDLIALVGPNKKKKKKSKNVKLLLRCQTTTQSFFSKLLTGIPLKSLSHLWPAGSLSDFPDNFSLHSLWTTQSTGANENRNGHPRPSSLPGRRVYDITLPVCVISKNWIKIAKWLCKKSLNQVLKTSRHLRYIKNTTAKIRMASEFDILACRIVHKYIQYNAHYSLLVCSIVCTMQYIIIKKAATWRAGPRAVIAMSLNWH